MRERGSHALLLALLLGHLFLLSTHEYARGNRLEEWMLRFLGPVGHAMVGTSATARDFLASWRFGEILRRENATLRRELAELRYELTRLHGMEQRLDRLARASGYTPPETGEVVVADVVWVDQASWLRTLVLYTGTVEPARNQPVVTANGLVGRIIVPAGRYAKVLLLSDPSLVVSAMVSRTRQRGLARGTGGAVELDHIPLLADVAVGDEVVTAGIDGVFPRGIPIGRVSRVEQGQGLFQRVTLEAAVDFEALDQVFVLTQPALPDRVRETLSSEAGDAVR